MYIKDGQYGLVSAGNTHSPVTKITFRIYEVHKNFFYISFAGIVPVQQFVATQAVDQHIEARYVFPESGDKIGIGC